MYLYRCYIYIFVFVAIQQENCEYYEKVLPLLFGLFRVCKKVYIPPFDYSHCRCNLLSCLSLLLRMCARVVDVRRNQKIRMCRKLEGWPKMSLLPNIQSKASKITASSSHSIIFPYKPYYYNNDQEQYIIYRGKKGTSCGTWQFCTFINIAKTKFSVEQCCIGT